MDTKAITDYLKEFANPSLQCLPNEPLNPMDIQQYLAEVESLRLAFVTEVLGCTNEALVSVYVDELRQAVKKVQQRGHYSLKNENIIAAITGGVKEMELVNDAVLIDRGLLSSAEKALKVLSSTKEDAPDTVNKTAEPTIANRDNEEIITGIRKLAAVIGCKNNKAQAIVSSRILEKEGIQWNAGCWKFNKAKLLQFMKDNPNAFASIKCKR